MIKKRFIGFCILILPILTTASEIDFKELPIGNNVVNLIIDPISLDSAPTKNIKNNVKAKIKNIGSSAATNILIKFYVDKNLKDTLIVDQLDKNKDMNLIFDWIPDKGVHIIQIVVESSEDDSNLKDNIANKKVRVYNKINYNIKNIDATLSIPPYFIFKNNTNVKVKSFVTNYGTYDLENIPIELYIDTGIDIIGNAKKIIYSLKVDETKELTWLVIPKTKYEKPGNIMIIKIGDNPMSDKIITYDGVHGFI